MARSERLVRWFTAGCTSIVLEIRQPTKIMVIVEKWCGYRKATETETETEKGQTDRQTDGWSQVTEQLLE